MGTQNDYSVVRELANKIYYIEPNFVGGRRDNVPVSLEDLSVYVELKVEYNQTVTEVRKGGSYDIVLQVKLNREGSASFVNLYSGVKYNNGNDVFLSTEGYENYTLDRISHSNTEEMFGVESINISYNSFGVPEIEIKFVDIKGAALHGAEELAHDINGNQVANISLTSKFLSCFYTVPFPRFQLVVKGYYGKPVFYDLTCSDLRSSFNAKSGNYDITVKMVGYSFALISDITFDSLLAAPYSKTGDDYWQDQINSGRFTINGKPMHKLTEIVNLWNDRLSDLQIEEDKGALQEQISTSLDNAHATYRSLIGLCATIRKNYSDYLVFDDESRLLFYKKTDFNELSTATSVFEEFQNDAVANMGVKKL